MLPQGLVLGTWALGGDVGHGSWGPQSDEHSRETIRAALDAGVCWFDTAAVYGNGRAEKLLCEVLSSHPAESYIAAKCGLLPNSGSGRPRASLSADSVRQQVELSLMRLGREQLDLCQIHWPHPNEDLEQGWETLAELQSEGKITALGVCNFSRSTLERLHSIHPIQSAQFAYNMIERGGKDDLFEYCQKNAIQVLAYAPLRAGLLSGKMSVERVESLDSDDWRRREKDFCSPMFEINEALVHELKKLAAKISCSVPALAVAWVLANESIDAVIVGARSAPQITENLAAATLSLSPEVITSIKELLEQRDDAARALR